MTAHEIKLYFAYTSPYSYLAMQPAYDLEQSHNVRVRFIPYGVNIRKVYGPLDREDADRRKVRYLYIDARRIAKERGLVIYPPKKIFSARLFGEFRFIFEKVAVFGDCDRASRRGRNDCIGTAVLQRANVRASEISRSRRIAGMEIERSAA